MNVRLDDVDEEELKRMLRTCNEQSNGLCLYPLHRALWVATEGHFDGEYRSAVDEPEYIISLDKDSKTDVPITDGQHDERHDPNRDAIHGCVNENEWVEPVVGIGASYAREYRWAYICDSEADNEISANAIHIERIYSNYAPLEMYAAHDETTVIRR